MRVPLVLPVHSSTLTGGEQGKEQEEGERGGAAQSVGTLGGGGGSAEKLEAEKYGHLLRL